MHWDYLFPQTTLEFNSKANNICLLNCRFSLSLLLWDSMKICSLCWMFTWKQDSSVIYPYWTFSMYSNHIYLWMARDTNKHQKKWHQKPTIQWWKMYWVIIKYKCTKSIYVTLWKDIFLKLPEREQSSVLNSEGRDDAHFWNGVFFSSTTKYYFSISIYKNWEHFSETAFYCC